MSHLASWTDELSPDQSIQLIRKLALKHTARIQAGKVGKEITELILGEKYLQLCEYELDYETISVAEAIQARQALALFKKCRYIDMKVDKEKRAIDKFMLSESICRETNEMFAAYDQGLFNFEPWVESAYRKAQHKISQVLGELPHVRDLKLRFGPGATTLTKKKNASVVEKLQAGLSCSEDLLPYASRLLEEMPHIVDFYWKPSGRTDEHYDYGHVPISIAYGKMCFVLKDALIHRIIVTEPPLSTMLQAGLGDYMKMKLKRNGIDISDQTINKRFAREGSLTGELCTLDLVDASGRIAIAVPTHLLPWEWSFMLGTARTSKVLLPGQSQRDTPFILEQFSSMGNGFTFPLETLIFWALASSVSEDGFASVYGDDIIVRTRDAEKVVRLLQIFGFEVNKKKSFWTGPFRESCGGDYLSGIDIRPYYHKELISGMELFKMHNFYVRHLDPEMAEFVLEQIPAHLRIFGPDGYGDGHLLGDWLPRRKKRFDLSGYGGYLFDTFKLCSVYDERYHRPGDRILPLYAIYVRENAESVIPSSLKVVDWEANDPMDTNTRVRHGVYRRMNSVVAAEEILERKSPVDGVVRKTPSLPGTRGYKRVSIYTLTLG